MPKKAKTPKPLHPTKTTYWIYTLGKRCWEEYCKYEGFNITVPINYNVIKGSTILLYYLHPNPKYAGFFGVLDVKSDQKDKKTKVFTDSIMNRTTIELDEITIFEKPIPIKPIFEQIKADKTGFKNIAGFKTKHCKGIGRMVKMDVNGAKLVEALANYEEPGPKKPPKPKPKPKPIPAPVPAPVSESDGEDDADSDDDNPNQTPEEVVGLVPVLVEPCSKFKLPDRGRRKYFRSHLKMCLNCQIVNNNTQDFGTVLRLAEIDVVDQDDEDYEEAMDAYQTAVGFDMENGPYMKVFVVEEDDMYQGTLLVVWTKD